MSRSRACAQSTTRLIHAPSANANQTSPLQSEKRSAAVRFGLHGVSKSGDAPSHMEGRGEERSRRKDRRRIIGCCRSHRSTCAGPRSGIEQNPDPFPRDVLAREPQGDEAMVRRETEPSYARTAGVGPPVVLVHGFGVTLLEWNMVGTCCWPAVSRDRLRPTRSRTLDDRDRWIGSAPMAADYAAVLDHFDVRDGVLVGHSSAASLQFVPYSTTGRW